MFKLLSKINLSHLPAAILTCLLVTISAAAQMVPKPDAPLYGARSQSGPVATGLPKALQNVGIDQKLNQQVPLDLTFRDETGNTVTSVNFSVSDPSCCRWSITIARCFARRF